MFQFKRFSTFFFAAMLAFLVGCAATSKQEGTGEYFDDTILTTKVKAAVINEPSLKSAEINVETFKGIVQLSGFVKTVAERNRAVQLARGIAGVRQVKNDILIR